MGSNSIVLERIGGVAKLTMNRPEKSNAFDDSMTEGFLESLDSCEHDRVRCLVITGAGNNFCAGQDLAAFLHRHESAAGVSFRDHLTQGYNRIVQRMKNMEIPLVAAV